ncbi:SseB family protein [Nocardioides daejeonensis]|uniref:SseB family protein n=1 Tax=Nocardioides daejeonensis TaxID=1046556 RepID=UPI000D74C604|nr:SseB family protein [Nocardioides daejeonensis]
MVNPDRFEGARLQASAFPDDDGAADASLDAALSAWRQDRSRSADVLRALASARLLVPVVALLGEVEYDEQGLAHDKSSDMAAVLMRGRDGRLALLAFTGTERLTAWNPESRPVAVPAAVAAQSALQDDAAALVLDVAGPVTFVVEGDDLVGLAAGWELVEVDGRSGWLRPTE